MKRVLSKRLSVALVYTRNNQPVKFQSVTPSIRTFYVFYGFEVNLSSVLDKK